jgi:hypothetical protein
MQIKTSVKFQKNETILDQESQIRMPELNCNLTSDRYLSTLILTITIRAFILKAYSKIIESTTVTIINISNRIFVHSNTISR